MSNLDNSLESVTAALQSTRVSPNGVSFAGKSLKLDTEQDAKEVTDEINKCTDLQYLNMEGNTLGVEAAKSVAQALEKHPEFKRALWKDMFTGRMKTEIPKALEFLGEGLVTAGARLVELDLSDNAFGPIGVQGLAALLKSSSCYALEELRLNNNGLGITGGKLLAAALTDCYESSKKQGKALGLKVFIAGRNRLENDGAKALAQVFKTLGTLEEIAMPQNGIYHVGITALSEAFVHNKNLQILNLNDNTIGEKGAKAIAAALPDLQQLKQINFGDCLLKTKGAVCLARALSGGHGSLEEVIMAFNEIKIEGGLEVAEAMSNKAKMRSLVLDGNFFGEAGKEKLEQKLKEIGKFGILGSLDENESEGEEEDEEEENGESEEGSEDSDEDSDEEEVEEETNTGHNISVEITNINNAKSTVQDFFKIPSADNFINIGENREKLISEQIQPNKENIEETIKRLMQISALSNNLREDVGKSSMKLTKDLFIKIFTWAQTTEYTSIVVNYVLVHLGLIKSEDKTFKITWNLDGCYHALKTISTETFLPENMKNSLKILLQKDIDNNGGLLPVKKDILNNLK